MLAKILCLDVRSDIISLETRTYCSNRDGFRDLPMVGCLKGNEIVKFHALSIFTAGKNWG